MNLKKYNNEVTHRTIGTIIYEATNTDNKIKLDAAYQRDVVWSDEKKGAFINSVMKNITPNNLIINKNEDGTKECIDGKQRITSLILFKNNKIYTEIDDKKYFYDKIPMIYRTDDSYQTLDQRDRNIFLDRKIPFVEYDELTYDECKDIFHRLQNGMVLKEGEMIPSMFNKLDICQEFNIFCRKKESIMGNFLSDISRKQHVQIITEIMYMINKKKLGLPIKKPKRSTFIKSIDSVVKLKKYIKKIDNLIDICFGSKLFGHTSIKILKLSKYIYMTIIYLIDDKYHINEIEDNEFVKFRSVIRKVYRITKKNIIRKNGMTKIKKIRKLYNVEYRYIFKKNGNITDYSDSDSDSDDSCDDSDDSCDDSDDSDDEYIIKKNIIIVNDKSKNNKARVSKK